MINNRAKSLLIALGGLLVLGISLYTGINNTEPTNLSSLMESEGYNLQSNQNYSIDKVGKKKVAGISITEITAYSHDKRVETQIFSDVSQEFAENYISDRKRELISTYTDTPAPYEGIPEREVNCPERFIPDIDQNSSASKYNYQIYADEKMNIGSCSNSTADFKVETSILYCKETEKLIETKNFVPLDEESFYKVDCNR